MLRILGMYVQHSVMVQVNLHVRKRLEIQEEKYFENLILSTELDIQSLTKAIIFELFYYINGYLRVWLTSMNIHSKCHTYLLY